MRAFLAELARDPWLSVPWTHAEARWDGAAEHLIAEGAVWREAARDGDRWPCRASGGVGCARVLICEADGWVAVCGEDPPVCEPEPALPERVRVDPCGWLRFLARACGLAPRPVEPGPLSVIGCWEEGRQRVGFVWCGAPGRLSPDRIDACAEALRPDALVVLVPSLAALPPSFPARSGRCRVLPIALDASLDPALGRVDLADVVLRAGIGGPAFLEPRFELVLAADAVRWAGRAVDLSRHPQQLALIRELHRGRGAWRSRADLMPSLFPDEFTNRGRALTDPVKLERRLRQLVARVNAAAGPHPDGRELIENLRGRTDLDGGYRLSVPFHRTIDLEVSDADRP